MACHSKYALLGCFASALLYPLAIHTWGPLVAFAITPAILSFCLAKRFRLVVALAWGTGALGSFLTQHTLWVVTLPGTAFLACYQGLTWIPMAIGVRSLWRCYQFPLTISWPIAWCAGECLRTLGPLGTNFGTLAVPETTTTWMLQIVDLAGAGIAAFPLAMTQGWFADAILAGWKVSPGRDRHRFILRRIFVSRSTTALLVTWIGVTSYGYWRLQEIKSNLNSGPTLTVIATDIVALPGGQSSYDPDLLLKKLQDYTKESVEFVPEPKMVVWPEGMLGSTIKSKAFLSSNFDHRIKNQFFNSGALPQNEEVLRLQWENFQNEAMAIESTFQQWVESLGVPVTIGMEAWLESPQDSQMAFERHNAAVLFDPVEGQSTNTQSKCRLYPHGEFIPWKGTLLENFLNKWIGPPRTEYTPGKTRLVYKLKGTDTRYVISLCSELKYNHLKGEKSKRLIKPNYS